MFIHLGREWLSLFLNRRIFFQVKLLRHWHNVFTSQANSIKSFKKSMEQHALKIQKKCLNTNIYFYLETSGDQSSNLYLNVVHFFNASVN